jgi:hypothetical protein
MSKRSALTSLGTPHTTRTLWSNGWLPRWNAYRTTHSPAVSSLSSTTNSIREVIHGNYRIVYRLRPDLVEIATVFHGAHSFRLD